LCFVDEHVIAADADDNNNTLTSDTGDRLDSSIIHFVQQYFYAYVSWWQQIHFFLKLGISQIFVT